MNNSDILVIGAGVAGIEASLLLADTGKKVYLVEKASLTGGNVIKYEDVFSNMECSTCMIAPKQQEVLQSENIELLTLSTVEKVQGEIGDFTVTIKKKARYVSLVDCIGCGMCYEPCPVSLKNEFEQNLSEKKAIYVPCPGSLPNVPAIDPEYCLQLNGKKTCNACVEACAFGAINLSDKDEKIEIKVGAIIVASGFDIIDPAGFPQFGYGKYPNVYTAMEAERLYASNGPTEGEITLRKGDASPKSIAIIQCVGREQQGYCSSVCCMYSLKLAHYLKHKLPDAKIYNFHSDWCMPGKYYQKFHHDVKEEGVDFIYSHVDKIKVDGNDKGLSIEYYNEKNEKEKLSADMVILSLAMMQGKDTASLSKLLGIEQDTKGFFMNQGIQLGAVNTSKPGIFLAGCAEGPKDIQGSITQAEAVVGKVMSYLS